MTAEAYLSDREPMSLGAIPSNPIDPIHLIGEASPDESRGYLKDAASGFSREMLAGVIATHAQSFDQDLIAQILGCNRDLATQLVRNPAVTGDLYHSLGIEIGLRLRTTRRTGMELRNWIWVGLRRRILCPSLLQVLQLQHFLAGCPGMEPLDRRETQRWLTRTATAIRAGADSPDSLTEALLPAYRRLVVRYADDSDDEPFQKEDRVDPAGHLLVHHPRTTPTDVHRWMDDWTNAGIAAALGHAGWIGGSTLLQHPDVRRRVRRYVSLPDVACGFASHPERGDFASSLRVVLELRADLAGPGLDPLLREAVTPEALGWLPEDLRLRLLQDANQEVRLKAMLSVGRVAPTPSVRIARTR